MRLSNLLLLFSGDATTFLPATGVVPSTEDVASRWITLTVADDSDISVSAGGQYQTSVSGVLSAWTAVSGAVSGKIKARVRGDASASYETSVTHTLTVATVEYDFVVTTMVEPVAESDVTFGGESVTFDGDPAVTF